MVQYPQKYSVCSFFLGVLADQLNFPRLEPPVIANTQVNPTGLPQRFVNGIDEFIDRDTTINSFMLQYFVNRNFEKGWYLTS